MSVSMMHSEPEAFGFPPYPTSLEETGIDKSIITRLIAKTMLTFETATPTQLASELKLPKMILNPILDELRNLSLIEARGLAGRGDLTSDLRYALTSSGNNFASEALEQSQYVGPAPVPLAEFSRQVSAQTITRERVHRETLLKSLSHLVLPEYLTDVLGPAVNSGRSILFYGEPGNGKTSIAEALGTTFHDTVYFPYCVEVGGQIINFFDDAVHKKTEQPKVDTHTVLSAANRHEYMDPRWVACKRPVVLTGGELTLDQLDLSFNGISKYYEAPLHFKAVGGVFIVDDFGRQRTEPQTILNRWIVPLDRGYDFLTLNTGKKFTIPFDELVVFSTNIFPHDLADEASLRRLYYKIHIPNPTKEDYIKIFYQVAKDHNLVVPSDIILEFFSKYYKDVRVSAHHPNYIVKNIIAACEYHDRKPAIDMALLDYAWHNLHVDTKDAGVRMHRPH